MRRLEKIQNVNKNSTDYCQEIKRIVNKYNSYKEIMYVAKLT